MVFSLPGIHVDLSASNDQRVTLTGVHRQLAALYFCEVSADAPLFHTEIQSTRLDVVDTPQSAPVLIVDRLRYSAGDNIRANCSSPLSYPPANLTWYLNGEKVNKTYTTTIPLNPDLWEPSSSFSVLEVGTEEQMQHPRYQVGGSQQEISSSQLKIPITSPEITVYTAYSPVPKVPNDNQREHKYYENIERGKSGLTESSLLDYPLPVNTIPLKITKIRLQPGFGGVVKLKCEATIYDVYKVSSEIVKIREETPHIALVMGQSSTGCVSSNTLKQWLMIVATTMYALTVWKVKK
ncbi:uncharacterized protein LOC143917683 [Arctopsyche grandis]|uniref:uncharacterized protein LOC143917683 n=1 Tax=Arctopsyche grandis TaxID=121162 RepID=UPI00406DA17C